MTFNNLGASVRDKQLSHIVYVKFVPTIRTYIFANKSKKTVSGSYDMIQLSQASHLRLLISNYQPGLYNPQAGACGGFDLLLFVSVLGKVVG